MRNAQSTKDRASRFRCNCFRCAVPQRRLSERLTATFARTLIRATLRASFPRAREGSRMDQKNVLNAMAKAWGRVGAAAGVAMLGLATSMNVTAAEPTATVIEYYNATLNHYFMTAYPEEAAMLDFGVLVPGWKRTGVEFHAWTNAGDAAGTVPVCRFFGT